MINSQTEAQDIASLNLFNVADISINTFEVWMYATNSQNFSMRGIWTADDKFSAFCLLTDKPEVIQLFPL